MIQSETYYDVNKCNSDIFTVILAVIDVSEITNQCEKPWPVTIFRKYCVLAFGYHVIAIVFDIVFCTKHCSLFSSNSWGKLFIIFVIDSCFNGAHTWQENEMVNLVCCMPFVFRRVWNTFPWNTYSKLSLPSLRRLDHYITAECIIFSIQFFEHSFEAFVNTTQVLKRHAKYSYL